MCFNLVVFISGFRSFDRHPPTISHFEVYFAILFPMNDGQFQQIHILGSSDFSFCEIQDVQNIRFGSPIQFVGIENVFDSKFSMVNGGE